MITTPSSLLDQLRLPDQPAAWDRFVRLYSPLLRDWAMRQGFHHADAADVVQDVLVKLLELLPEYTREPGRSFRRWLHRVTVNQCRDFRRRRRATRELPGDDGLSGVDLPEGADAEAEENAYRQEIVARALELIRPEFANTTWAAFEQHVLGGVPAADVAADLGITPNAVYLARHRILTRLRREIDGFLD